LWRFSRVVAVAAAVAAFPAVGSAEEATASRGPASETGNETELKSADVPGGVSGAKSWLNWRDTDQIEAFYGEFLLAQWVLDAAPWNAYHSGIGFKNSRTQDKVVFDFAPQNTSSVLSLVVPDVQHESEWQAVLLGQVTLGWRDGAKLIFHPTWPKAFENFVSLGKFNGTVFNSFVDWVVEYFEPRFKSFQPLEVASSAAGRGRTILRSRMCHDFVTDALWILYNNGAKLKAEKPIFRDHIILYARHMIKADDFAKTRRGLRTWLRYLRSVFLYIDEIKKQFTSARHALIANWKMGIPVFLHDMDHDYELHLMPPFINYCYLPLAIPPKVHDPFGTNKLCALSLEANVSNTTAPMPWGALLAAEQSMDRPEVFVALILMVLVAVLSVEFTKPPVPVPLLKAGKME